MITLALLWTGWCFLHSLLITAVVNSWFLRRGGLPLALYRIGYNLVAVLTLIPLLWYQFSLPAEVLFGWFGAWRLPQALLLVYAVTMFLGGKRNYDMAHFMGTRQWREHREGRPPSDFPFRANGVSNWVRHPWYSGGLALLWAFGPVTDVNLVGRLVLSGYLVVGSLLEERKLKGELGHAYQEYCRKVPMLVPWKGRWGRD